MNIDRELFRFARSRISSIEAFATGGGHDYLIIRLSPFATAVLMDAEDAGSPYSVNPEVSALDVDAEVHLMTSPDGDDEWNGTPIVLHRGSTRACVEYLRNFAHWNQEII